MSRIGPKTFHGFTLIELLVVVGIIAMLISILMPALGRARQQAKAVHCLARLHDFGTGLMTYATDYDDSFPPALWLHADPDDTAYVHRFGWSEVLWSYVYKEEIRQRDNFPVQRNVEGKQWAKYFLCRTSKRLGVSSGHYRVYLPSWSYGTYSVPYRQRWELTHIDGTPNYPDPESPTSYSALRPKLVLIGDANDRSYRGNDNPVEDVDGDGFDDNDGSWIDPGEANESGVDGNRFSDRHYGFTNFLFADMHGEKDRRLRETLARDWDLNGIDDITEEDDNANDNEGS